MTTATKNTTFSNVKFTTKEVVQFIGLLAVIFASYYTQVNKIKELETRMSGQEDMIEVHLNSVNKSLERLEESQKENKELILELIKNNNR